MDLAALRKIEIEIDGEWLAHYMRELPSNEWLAWQRKLGTLNGDGDTLHNVLLWYDEHVVKVEGYVISDVGADLCVRPSEEGGTPPGGSEPQGGHADPPLLMIAFPEDWRDKIPGAHKFAVWNESITGANAKKKSSTISTSSETSPSDAQEK